MDTSYEILESEISNIIEGKIKKSVQVIFNSMENDQIIYFNQSGILWRIRREENNIGVYKNTISGVYNIEALIQIK